ncbi:MAG: hypothetical protein KA120_02780 [Candidatus Goldbacteria bacterium]|nr:hypothetical protein [Candidatus Goldiibacteriota bacterium]
MEPFIFNTRLHLTIILGKKAVNLVELLEGIKTVPGSCIYYHTHKFLQQHHYLSPEPPNDFAFWITNILQEKILGEQFAAVDIIQYKSIAELRKKFIDLLEDYLKYHKQQRESPPGSEFQFLKSESFVLTTNHVANNLKEFYEIFKDISINSLYFHMFEARLRLEKPANDFSLWLESIGENKLAEKIAGFDPYTMTLNDLKNKITKLLEKRLNDG